MEPKRIEIDYAKALKRLGGSKDLFQQQVRFFDEDISSLLDELEHGIESANSDEAVRAAHSIKGLVSTLGAHSVAEMADQIQQHCKDGQFVVAAHRLPILKTSLGAMSSRLNEFGH